MPSPAARQAILLSGGAILPVWQANLLGASSLPAGLTWTVPTTLRTQYDSTGKLTYGGNNLILQSQTLSTSPWSTGGTSTLSSGITAPDGTATAFQITYAGAGSRIVQTVNPVAASPIIYSIYVKIASVDNGATLLVYDNTAGGTAAQQSFATIAGSGIDAGNGWRRIYLSVSGSISGHSLTFYLYTDKSNGAIVGSSLYAWGAQVEAVTYQTTPSAYNATTSAAYYAPRFDYDPSTLAPRGLLVEEARTNIALYSRDMTNAAWVKSSITAALNQTGLDGVANSASSITASGANGTILQTVTLASSQRFYSAYVKRITGSGAVSMTTDNGTTWTAITVTGSWTQVSIPAQTVTNPVFGFKLATNGDAIAVDCNQNEGGAFATSAIITTSASVQRTADVITFSGVPLAALQGASGGVILQLLDESSANPAAIKSIINGTNNILYHDTTGKVGTTNGTNILLTGSAATWSGATRIGLAWGPSARAIAATGLANATDTNSASNGGTLYLGSSNGSTAENAWFQGISLYNQNIAKLLQSKMTVNGPY